MKFHPPTICPPLLIAGAIFIASLDAKGDSDPLLTVVKAKHLKQKPLGDHKAISQASAARANPSEVLPELLGITLNRQGGPLAPADIKMRGLGSSRLSVQLEGLELADPGTGLIDAND
jgi:outer membrane cobalamin receptor